MSDIQSMDDKVSIRQVQRKILLSPGPATTSNSVKVAQVVPDICPRESEFGVLLKDISESLTGFVADIEKYTTVLFGGSGTAAVESVISSVVEGDDAILIVNNGAYGQRMCEIAEACGVNYVEFSSSEIEPLHTAALEATIQSAPHTKYIAIVHNETTTGLLNDLSPIAELSTKYGLGMIVDAMSSYGAIPIDVKQMNIDFLCASSNKNLQGMAGVGFVVAKISSIENLKGLKSRSFYLDLFSQYDFFRKTGQMRFTPPVQTLYALKQAIIETKEEGIDARYKRYSKSWEVLVSAMEDIGLKLLVSKVYHSKIITSIELSDEINFDDMHDHFYRKGFTVYPGKIGQYRSFRIANIGDINYRDMECFIAEFREYIGGLTSLNA